MCIIGQPKLEYSYLFCGTIFIRMNRYIELYNELQDFKRQQPFGFTQFFGNLPARVYDQNGVVTQQAPFLFLHERVRELLASLSAVQIQKYTANLSRTMDLFVRWLQARRPGWRGRAPGKENEQPPPPPPPAVTRTQGFGVRYRRSGYRLP